MVGFVVEATLKAWTRSQAIPIVIGGATVGKACGLVMAFSVAFSTTPSIACSSGWSDRPLSACSVVLPLDRPRGRAGGETTEQVKAALRGCKRILILESVQLRFGREAFEYQDIFWSGVREQ
jgi:hypothetical protein